MLVTLFGDADSFLYLSCMEYKAVIKNITLDNWVSSIEPTVVIQTPNLDEAVLFTDEVVAEEYLDYLNDGSDFKYTLINI